MSGLLDVILGYDCNLACDYCTITPEMRRRSLTAAQVVAAMRAGRAAAYDRVAFTGGEPTIRGDLLGLVRAARALGFSDVKVQSNGLMLGQADNARRLRDAGVDRVHVSIHTHVAAAYDALVRSPGSHARMVAGLDAVVASGAAVVADVIVKADTLPRLPAAIAWLWDRGVRAADLWFVSLTDGNRGNAASLPRMTAAAPIMAEAFASARARGMTLRSLHVPRCLLGEDHVHAYDPGAQRVRVVTPEASFELRDSRLAGRVHVPACAGCPFEQVCPGVRPDYLEVYGDEEIATARGQAPTVRPRRLPVIAVT
ncbi:MAG: radical SAM protein [Myxococcales bacterium]|nr:radical SAM protein [Myxococcales bacterium]